MKKKEKTPLGLYLHVPFCRCKCSYCDFYSLPGQGETAMKRYVRVLARQLEQAGAGFGGYGIDTVYLGGGTPSLLPTDQIVKLLRAVERGCPLESGAEVTLEANPESAGSWRRLRRLRRAGINRLSLGVQAADDGLLRRIGRIHTFDQATQAVAAARRAGIENVSADLIFGLPGQDLAAWLRDLDRVLALEVDHLSCYGLKVEEGTPLARQMPLRDLPGDDEQADMYLAAAERLARAGFEHYEISNFARPGRRSRHNWKYWTLQEYAGFGPGAHSDMGGVRCAYGRDLDAYVRGAEAGTLRLEETEKIPPEERDTEYIMLSLRTAEGMSRRVFEYRYRRRFAPLEPVFEKYRALGCAEPTAEGWRLTARGFLLSNTIITDLWEAHGREKLRRAQAAERGDFRVELE